MSDEKKTGPAWGPRWKDGLGSFHFWAPAATSVKLKLDGRTVAMMHDAVGHWRAQAPCPPGAPYRFEMQLAGGEFLSVADPASRLQNGDVDDDSLVVDSDAYQWACPDWQGRPWHEAVIYELHIGALGGFSGVTSKLPGLAALGFTAVELMPVADFPGERNWGYDGVLPFAPDTAYGSPEELKKLIDTAHGLGLMVLLDVVYNHFGPDGNYLHQYAPDFFVADAATAWGGAIDFGKSEVRRFFTANAVYWINEFRFDGLRIDAAHAIARQDWLVEMAAAVRSTVASERQVHLVLEHDGNAAGLLQAGFDAQWNDDAHHILHVLLTGETDGYYRDYKDQPAARLARCMSQGFDYQGEPSAHRAGQSRGERSDALPPTAFVFFLQNHDQIGNRALGERLTTLAHPAALRAAQALQLLAPHIPLVFMGEEAASTDPFLYFTSHRTAELTQAVREGRAREFAASAGFADEQSRTAIPDPNDAETFHRSIPHQVCTQGDASIAWVKELLELRRRHIVPALVHCQSIGAQPLGSAAIHAAWALGTGVLTLLINLDSRPVEMSESQDRLALLALGDSATTLVDSGGVREDLAAGKLPGHCFLAMLGPR